MHFGIYRNRLLTIAQHQCESYFNSFLAKHWWNRYGIQATKEVDSHLRN